ncbi:MULTISPECIES: bifunctional folylpolyglutamate synthase/dihydrofolate synthase [Olivibacter]|jgi:dihydrofolate synthase/folylpolyglutamate synthase|uniref:Dihydrofolate synthase/folylpolyglutamate synthase n=1 Tax=Olivibacter oleidegradans TaxID=760123 RepID=A0ABV6HHI7_9SPHI|nr:MULTISPECIES: folylpolyglutamate synthase/dihydrofolate synthase family protein [unclassified Olivibacter]MDM8176517.1 folylpolyglutamate synthase/dihydrofolate synthase family protein [Olivibacter sp. 47]QEL00780.1 bifunctional folylpolyglutamate synthase/dihydrofolate synthase [Olivibacter sp. LS-1]
MNYIEVIDYLYGRLPMFTRDGSSAFKKDLTNIRALCAALENPEKAFKAVHIAGTNGKGSSSHMLAAVLQTAGYRTGLYTSPHLLDFRERIKINGVLIPQAYVIDFVKNNQSLIETIQPSFFEVTVAMAFRYFADMHVDIAVIETGLGGRLDSTNIISPIVTLITNIGYDHMNMLGNSLAEIAYEKAGIIKSHTPIVISERQQAIEHVFINRAQELVAPIFFASDEWKIDEIAVDTEFQYLKAIPEKEKPFETLELCLDLKGSYQQKNLPGVLSTIRILKEIGFTVSENELVDGLEGVQKLTGLMGRWQRLSAQPLTICDTGHNEDGWKEVIKNITRTPFEKLHMVIGVMRDKDLEHMLTLLPKEANFYFCSPAFQRALPAIDLQSQAANYGLVGEAYDSVQHAVETAGQIASKEDLIFIGGSTFVVAEALPLFQ